MTSKVFVVTEGEYSDYGIVAVFATRALAEAHASDEWLLGGSVEEYDLLEQAPAKVAWYVIDSVGRAKPGERMVMLYDYDSPPYNGREHAYTKWASGRRVYGRDPERVRKVFWDNWQREQAEAAGIA